MTDRFEGRFASLSAVLQQGVDLLRQRMYADEAATEALRELLSRRGGAHPGGTGRDRKAGGRVRRFGKRNHHAAAWAARRTAAAEQYFQTSSS